MGKSPYATEEAQPTDHEPMRDNNFYFGLFLVLFATNCFGIAAVDFCPYISSLLL